MAGDWLKMEHTTPDKPETFAIAAMLGIDDPDLVVGKLFRVWRWFDQHTADGNAKSVTPALLDRIACCNGFATAMQSVGWLVVTDNGLSLPKFDRHNGKTAKNRADTARRVARHRDGNAGCNAPTVTETVQNALAREEKRREEEKQSVPVPVTPPTVVPIKPEKPEAEKRKALTFSGWLKTIPDGELAIPSDHYVFNQAERAGLPYQFVELEWEYFRWKYSNNPKRYTDWRQTFANAVAGAWGNLWRAVPAGGYELTSQGIQFQRTLEAAA